MKPTEVQRRIAEIEECLDDNKCPTNTPRVLERALEALKALAPPADLAPVAAAMRKSADEFVLDKSKVTRPHEEAARILRLFADKLIATPAKVEEVSPLVGEMPENITAEQRERFAQAYIRDWCPDTVKDYVASLIAPPASNPSETVSKVEGAAQAVAWYAQGICHIEFVETDKEAVSRYIQNSNKALPVNTSPQYHLRGPLPLYTHPAPPILSAVELEALEWLENLVPDARDTHMVKIIAKALRSRATQPAVRQGAVGSYPVATQPAAVVDDAMVERACNAMGPPCALPPSWVQPSEQAMSAMRSALAAALAPGGG